MGSCIICGTSVDGRICELHEEDVVFEFRGDRPNQLTVDRYYRGSVDGFAEFGVFVDIGDSVTGLLHESELDRRLESLDWDPGDPVFVQVQNVRDNGNVDLGWSIRQDEREFRGTLIDDPDAEHEQLADDDRRTATDGTGTAEPSPSPVEREEDDETDGGGEEGNVSKADAEPGSDEDRDRPSADDHDSRDAASPSGTGDSSPESATAAEPDAVTVDELDDRVGDPVRLEGEVVEARQTGGPTIFVLADETGTVDCAAFEEAGVRAYPEVGEGDVVRLTGEVERRRGDLQVETEELVALEGDERDAVSERIEQAALERARPEAVEPLAEDAVVEAATESLREAATAVRRAVVDGRPVIVRHAASVDGYLAGAAIERATLPLVREEHRDSDAEYHYFDRRPVEGTVYDLDDATGDVSSMLSNEARHGEKVPLFVFVAAGGTAESLDGYDLLSVYGAPTVVLEDEPVDDAVAEAVDVAVAPADRAPTTATVFGATLAAAISDDVRADLAHLPAASFWEETPAAYADLAEEAGYGADAVRELREAVALSAFYQLYEDKRELVTDLVFGETADDRSGLAGHVSEQYRTRVDDAVETARANLDVHAVDGTRVLVLDTEAHTHEYEFPPTDHLLDVLFRRERESADALVGLGQDEAFVRTDADLDVRAVVDAASETAPAAGIDSRGAQEGRIEFLAGERAAVRAAVLDALGDELSAAPTP